MKYDRTIIAYHGCDRSIADRLLAGESFKKSQNDYDWLGEGIYFWEFGFDRARQFAIDQTRRGKVLDPSVVGAVLQLGECFDLMDTRFTTALSLGFDMLSDLHDKTGQPLPTNEGATPDKLRRRRDCAVLNFYLNYAEEELGRWFDSVRCGFVEGAAAYDGSGIRSQSHVQIAIRNPACVIGVFRPTMLS